MQLAAAAILEFSGTCPAAFVAKQSKPNPPFGSGRLKLIGMAYSNAQLTVARSPAAMVVLFHELVFISSCCSQTT
jgi:hypothetical protein